MNSEPTLNKKKKRKYIFASSNSVVSSAPQKYLIYAVLWSFSGDGRLKMRAELGEYIRRITTVPLPAAPNVPIIDYEVRLFRVIWCY